jgi:asparagine synthase (glutamine-hydrolysing)
MCGIAGLIHFDREAVADGHVLRQMTDAMVHRGPDDQGLYLDRHVALGHRRLSIIDRAAGRQPMSNEDDTIWITFNGEIYNFREIREELLANGHRFKTHCDTEVILHLYEDLEEGCVSRLHGMFAFAIWDRTRDRLLIARDRLGIKPLYYRVTPETLAFSSEIRPLLKLNGGAHVDVQGLHEVLTFRYNVAPRTAFREIVKLPPGHLLTLQHGTVSVKQYWDLDCSKKLVISEEEAIQEFSRRLRTSTQSHLVGEVPLGVLLSGGLDSTAIAATMAEFSEKRLQTFSVGFVDQDPDLDDRPYARLASKYLNTDHHELSLTAKEYAVGLRDAVWHLEEPMADPASVPLYCISRLAKDYVTVILSGEGSDEMLAGYTFWEALKGYRRAQWFRKMPRLLRQMLVQPLNETFFRSPRLDRYLRLADLPMSHYLTVVPSSMTDVFSEEAKQEVYSQHLRQTAHFTPAMAVLVDGYRKTTSLSLLDQMLYVYSTQWMPDELLLKADKMTMAHSLELRVPFLDPPLVDFMASLTPDLKMRRNGQGYTTKYILRKAMIGKIPHEILHRKKIGFSVPLFEIFDRELNSMAWDLFRSKAFRESGLFDEEAVLKLLRGHRGHDEQTFRVWSLLVFAVWLDLFQVSA